jgi:hypothetical protein
VNDPLPNEFRRGPPRLSDAVEPIASGSKPHDMTNIDDIAEALSVLAENGDPVSIYPSSSTNVVMARIRSVHPEDPYFTLELNEGEFIPPGECVFVAWLRSAKLQFKQTSTSWSALP